MSTDLKDLPQREQYLKILQAAGWYKGRKVDITDFKLDYKPSFSENVRRFLAEYSALNVIVYLGFESSGSKASYDYTFNLTPDMASQLENSKEYREIQAFSQEETLCIGLLGYYYPATCGIGRSGKLYFKHDYADKVEVFDSMLESIAFELRTNQDLSCLSKTQQL